MSDTKIGIAEFNRFQRDILVNDTDGDKMVGPKDVALVAQEISGLQRGSQVPFDHSQYRELRGKFTEAQNKKIAAVKSLAQRSEAVEKAYGIRLGKPTSSLRCNCEVVGVYRGENFLGDIASKSPEMSLFELSSKVAKLLNVPNKILPPIEFSPETFGVWSRHGWKLENGVLFSEKFEMDICGNDDAGYNVFAGLTALGTSYLKAVIIESNGAKKTYLLDLTTGELSQQSVVVDPSLPPSGL